MGAVLPFAGCPPLELCRLGCIGERGTGAQEGLDVDAVVHWCISGCHWIAPFHFLMGESPPGRNTCSENAHSSSTDFEIRRPSGAARRLAYSCSGPKGRPNVAADRTRAGAEAPNWKAGAAP